MRTLVIGGSASGKSSLAESLAMKSTAPFCYIATMMSQDEESLVRIKKHQAMRAQKSFSTVECYTGLAGLRLPPVGTVLLECLGNLMANELFAPEGAGSQAVESILSGIIVLEAQCLDLIVVTNDVFAGGQDFQDDTMQYVETLGMLNREISQRFDCVIEVVCGIPIVLNGGTL